MTMDLSHDVINEDIDKSNRLVKNDKVDALGLSLQQATENFREVVKEFRDLKIKTDCYKLQLRRQKEEYESKKCSNCTDLQSGIASKDNIIQLIASALTRLSDTKNLSIISEIYEIIFGETTTLTPPKDSESFEKRAIVQANTLLKHTSTPNLDNQGISILNYSIKEESVSEIESTPTGRMSPIIHSKKSKHSKDDSVETGVKKKCSNSWPTPKSKYLKLSYPYQSLVKTPKAHGHKGKLRQSRLELVKQKQNLVVDLTSPPELTGSPKNLQDVTKLEIKIKKEAIDNEDTILPSPTSGPVRSIFKSTTIKCSPQKFIKPSLFKIEPLDTEETNLAANNVQPLLDPDATRFENSVTLRFFKVPSSPKKPPVRLGQDENCLLDTNESLSLLQHVAQIEKDALIGDVKRKSKSPPKRPLAENPNATNLPAQGDSEVSVSLLHRDLRLNRTPKKTDVVSSKRRSPEKPEDIFKEPTARTKAEKRALPGWSCEECRNFYGELYRDNPDMLLAKMQECSRHRGKRDPARPKTPPNFWNPRWEVPEDTEAFNRRNNAR